MSVRQSMPQSVTAGAPAPAAETFISPRYLRPHPALRSWVSHYWELEGYFKPSEPKSLQRLLPGVNTAIIFQLATPVDVRQPDGAWQSRPAAFAEGHFHKPFNLRFMGEFRLVGISFAPGRMHSFLGDSQAQINDRFVDLSDMLGQAGGLLAERIHSASTFENIAGIFDEFLLAALADAEPENERGLNRAVRLALRRPLAASVKYLADAACLSPRQLERRFQDALGMSPKYFCRVARFDHFVKRWNIGSEERLTSLAQDCGYFDQSHLNRDFKWFTGETPTGYLHRDRAVPAAICKLHLEAAGATAAS